MSTAYKKITSHLMDRKNITDFLNNQLVQNRLCGRGKYYAREVSLDYGTTDVRRIDFLQFQPGGVTSVSDIEKGIFTSYEVKSCKADFHSGFGKNFVTEKNYFVMPMELYKEVVNEIPYNVGVICPVPVGKSPADEYEAVTPLNEERKWEMRVIKPAHPTGRKKSMTELLFCMLRSGK